MKGVNRISERKQQLIDDINNNYPKTGEIVYVDNKLVHEYSKSNQQLEAVVSSINEDKTITVLVKEYGYKDVTLTLTREQIERNSWTIGANPFDNRYKTISTKAYTLDSIIFNLDLDKREAKREKPYEINGVAISELNWNPYVYDKDGNKQYYQRGFVWSLEDKQLLVESIYKGIGCGVILIRKHSWEYLKQITSKGETEVAFRDVVDGKQRLNAISSFISNEFADMNGNYFDDLSASAQHKFTNHQLFQYAELEENTKDDEVIYQFLKLNFAGVPQSKEHINFVENIGKLLK